MRARVLKSTGSQYLVLDEANALITARLRGKLRLKGYEKTNPVSVGDYVQMVHDSTGEWLITDVEPRTNFLIRRSVNLSHKSHIIAANVDQAIVIVSLVQPATSTGFTDRILMVCEAYHIPAYIFINKTDLLSAEMNIIVQEWEKIYDGAGYRVIAGSASNGSGIEDLHNLIMHKTTLFAGHSGVGKSTLLNKLAPEINVKTADISGWSMKGKHTTTFAEMHRLNVDTWIVDTPGIKEFGIVGFEKGEIGQYFPEIREQMPSCRFNNCNHINEPDCAVLAALEAGTIEPSRYHSYCSIYYGDDVRQ